jgi:hypothetical protein
MYHCCDFDMIDQEIKALAQGHDVNIRSIGEGNTQRIITLSSLESIIRSALAIQDPNEAIGHRHELQEKLVAITCLMEQLQAYDMRNVSPF